MKKSHLFIRAFVVVGITVGATGCLPPQVNDSINGGLKLARGEVGTLTAGELKAVSDTVLGVVGGQTGQTLDPLSLEQAQALVNFLRANGINTFDDITALVELAEGDPSVIQGLAELAAAFPDAEANFNAEDFDPSQLEGFFGTIFGGMAGPSGGG